MERGVLLMARPRKITSVQAMETAWEEYKEFCDNQVVLTHEFSQRSSEFVSANLRKKITYTIEGFCVFIGIARSKFYQTYAEDERYGDLVSRMREECEMDARMKFETGQIPTQLSGLWMSKYGYTTKTDTNLNADLGVTIIDDIGV